MGFQTPQDKLATLLEQIHSGAIQLPDFQRSYRWDEERIRSLLVTIVRGYPLGSIMALETGNANVRFRPQPFAGTPAAAANAEPDKLILDGQQRLTSLYQSMWGHGIVDTTDVRGKKAHRRFFIDLRKTADPSDIPDDAVFSTRADGTLRSNFDRDVDLDLSDGDKQREQLCFPVALLLADGGEDWLFDLDDRAVAKSFLRNIRTPVKSYEIPSILLDKNTTKGAVATVFEKVNTGGLALSVFELLTATFAGDGDYYAEHGTDFRLVDDWAETQLIINKYPVLSGFGHTEFLQAVTLLTTQGTGTTSAKRADILRLELRDYIANADRIREALGWVARFLEDVCIHSTRDLPYPTQLVPLSVLRAVLGEKIEAHGVVDRLHRWLWCGILGELYGSTTETRFARDVDQVPDWLLAENEAEVTTPHTVRNAGFLESRLLSLKTRQSAAYKGIYALLMARDCLDWAMDQNFNHARYFDLQVDIHHIFPKQWCIDNDIDAERRESIVNKTPLSASTNRRIGSKSPADYMPMLERTARIPSDRLDQIVSTHLIDTAALRAADFDAFFLHRKDELIGLIERAMGKTVQRDLPAGDTAGGEEGSGAFVQQPDDPVDDAVEIEEAPHLA